MHDPRRFPGLATSYRFNATPGRHTQGGSWTAENKFHAVGLEKFYPKIESYKYSGKGKTHMLTDDYSHIVNAAGLCLFGTANMPYDAMPDFLTMVTGTEFTLDDMFTLGKRISTLRIAFNVREGIKPTDVYLSERSIGKPPFTAGPTSNVTVDDETQKSEFFEATGWDENGVPLESTLRELDLDFAADALYD